MLQSALRWEPLSEQVSVTSSALQSALLSESPWAPPLVLQSVPMWVRPSVTKSALPWELPWVPLSGRPSVSRPACGEEVGRRVEPCDDASWRGAQSLRRG